MTDRFGSSRKIRKDFNRLRTKERERKGYVLATRLLAGF